MARPTKRDDALVAAICERIEAGAYPEIAARACGIARTTFYRWQKNDEAFRDAIKKAAAEAECVSVSTVRRGAQGWQGSAWYLERRYPERYSQDRKKKQLEIARLKAELAAMKAMGPDGLARLILPAVLVDRESRAPGSDPVRPESEAGAVPQRSS